MRTILIHFLLLGVCVTSCSEITISDCPPVSECPVENPVAKDFPDSDSPPSDPECPIELPTLIPSKLKTRPEPPDMKWVSKHRKGLQGVGPTFEVLYDGNPSIVGLYMKGTYLIYSVTIQGASCRLAGSVCELLSGELAISTDRKTVAIGPWTRITQPLFLQDPPDWAMKDL